MNNIVFLSYINRSGSTFLLNKLSNYKNIFSCLEAEILIKMLLDKPYATFSYMTKRKLLKTLKNDFHFRSWHISEKEILQLKYNVTNFEVFCFLINALKVKLKPEADIVIFKGNSLFEFYKKISEDDIRYYNIKFLAMVRNPMAIFSSQKNSRFQNKPLNTNPFITANQWDWFINNVINNKNIYLIKYESLIKNFGIEFENILKYLQIENKKNDESKKLSKIIPNNFKQLHKKIDNKPDVTRINTWKDKLNKNVIYIIQESTKNNLNKMHYEIKKIEQDRFIVFALRSYYKLLIFLRLNRY